MLRIRHFAVGCFLLIAAPRLYAQQLPTPDQAQRLLQTRPDLVAQLRQEIASSGLTPDQIRARLRAAGYPENLLDAYVGSTASGRDSTSGVMPTETVLDAVAALGLTDSVSTADLRGMLRRRRAQGTTRDTLRIGRDSLLDPDSLMVLDSLSSLDSIGLRAMYDSFGRLVYVPRRPEQFSRQRAAARPDTGATIFGLNVFSETTTQFDPNLSGPVDANYRLGPGDRLVLIITGDAERAYTLDVTREGFIVIPGVGQIPVTNLTLGQLEEVLYPRLGKVFSGLNRTANATTHFYLNVAKLHSNQIFVLGDVDQPGSYRISSAGTALTALYAAGGPTKNGSLRTIEIRRAGRSVDTLDLYDYLLRADASHDSRLRSGDVLFVPVHGARVRIYGEVVRPATYELKRGETLEDLLRQAGGFTAEAARRRVQIARVLPPREREASTDRARVLIDISSAEFSTGAGPAYPMEPGDVVRVFAVSETITRRVSVRGDVFTPGFIGFTAGMRLSDALRTAGGIKPDAYQGEVLVSRLRASDSIRTELHTAFQDGTGRPLDDMPLREDDEVRVFSVTALRPRQFVAIAGAVRHSGRFAFHEGMTLRDLVLIAGGLEERASVKDAEIARRPASQEGGRLAVTTRVALDSSYLVLRAREGAARGPAGEIALQPADNVLILAQPDWEQARHVVVTGEVRSPGTYTLLAKSDRMSDVIQRAGGPTHSAYTAGVGFYRREGGLGRIGVDLPRVLRDTGYRDNLVLQDGDSLDIPAYTGVVEVQGAVNAPRGVAYVPGKNLVYYIRAAGGASKLGEEEHSYVTQSDGKVESFVYHRFWANEIPDPGPGSAVFVPEKDVKNPIDNAARLGIIAQVIGSLVTIIAVLHK